jgi:hypothetical protein
MNCELVAQVRTEVMNYEGYIYILYLTNFNKTKNWKY